jgi:transcriptional regulator with XRE-family HTH domain
MPDDSRNHKGRLKGHALRNAHLRERSLVRAQTAPPLARTLVKIRAEVLGMTRLEFVRRSGISRGTLRDLELGVHVPTRRTLRQFVAFCQKRGVSPELLEEVRRLYAGDGKTLEEFIARLELQAGSARVLAGKVGISPATLWEYQRGNFPLPLALLRRLCRAVGEESGPAEALWHEAERRRLLDRGYPEALAEFWVLCARAGHAEKHLPGLGMSTATIRRLRYLELPRWEEVAGTARALCQGAGELQSLEKLWRNHNHNHQNGTAPGFGQRLQQHRKKHGITRRELADLFGIGGKKPARIIKYIEEDGFYSAQAYPAGLVALLVEREPERARLLDLWQDRRRQFHRRHRPETRIDMRLARELYGFESADMERILGYSRLEYQRIERGVGPLLDTGRERILQAIHEVGQGRVEALFQLRDARDAEQSAWRTPASVRELITLLATREGGLVPLGRHLRRAGLTGLWIGRLRAIARGQETPPWLVLEHIARTCEVAEMGDVYHDWTARYRAYLQARCGSPLAVELRALIAEVAPTLRAFGARLPFNYSVLVRDLRRIDRDELVKWFHVERLLHAANLPADDERWREIRALWSTVRERNKRHKPATDGQGSRKKAIEWPASQPKS